MPVARAGPAGPFPAFGKIYDITHADLNEHSVALPAGYPANTRALNIYAVRIAGTGVFRTLSVTGDLVGRSIITSTGGFWIRSVSGLFLYRLTAINDNWDIFCAGYITA